MLRNVLECCCPCLKKPEDFNKSGKNGIVVGIVNDGFELDSANNNIRKKEVPKHPLQNGLVLRQIFRHLSNSDHLNCRLVCHSWHVQASKFTRTSSPPVWINTLELGGYNKLMTRTRDLPFTRFGLNLTSPAPPSSEDLRLNLRKFFQLLGSRVTLLIVHIYHEHIPYFVSQLNSPNLLSLLVMLEERKDIENDSITSYSASKEEEKSKRIKSGTIIVTNLKELRLLSQGECKFPSFIRDLLAQTGYSPQMDILDLKNWNGSISKIFTSDSAAGVLKTVSQLALGPVEEGLVKVVGGAPGRLTHLEMTLADGVDDDTLFGVFTKNARTLQELRMAHQGQGVLYLPEDMLHLQTLVIKEWNGPVLIDSIILRCPNLQQLDLEGINPDNAVVSIHGSSNGRHLSSSSGSSYNHSQCSFSHKTLERLSMGFDTEYARRKIKGVIKRIVPSFPNIKEFRWCSRLETDDIMELLIQCTTRRGGEPGGKLERLYLNLSMDVTDAGFTGIPAFDLESANKEEIRRLPCGCWVFKDVGKKRKNCYFGDYPDLTELHISIESGSSVSNLGLHHGILKLKQLQVLRIYSQGIRWCLLGIGDNLPNLKKLCLTSKNLYHEDDLDFIKLKLPDLVLEFLPDSEYVLKGWPQLF